MCKPYVSAKVGGTSKLSVKTWPIVFVSKTLTAKNFTQAGQPWITLKEQEAARCCFRNQALGISPRIVN